jgi:hypothetical protein
MARGTGGLSAAEIEQLRSRLGAGGRPRVRLTGPQFEPDAVGTIVRIGDPVADGEDYIVVRAKVAGTVDELAFGPAELRLGPARPARRPARGPAAGATRRKTTAARPQAAKPAPVTLTIASTGADWTVSAGRGSRSLLARTAVTPGTVTAIAELLGDPAVVQAVAAVNDTARSEAEARAERLRAELAAVQAILDTHRAP